MKEFTNKRELIETITPVIENTAQKDGEVIAAIAAVLALAESESGGTKFRVVSFKKR